MDAPPRAQIAGWVLALAAALLLAAELVGLALVAGPTLPERTGPAIEELSVERSVLTPGLIELTVRNTGPDPVQVAQVFVNDAYVNVTGAAEPVTRLATGTLRLDYPWLDGQPYLISLLTSTGVVIEHEIPVAVATPRAGPRFLGTMALLGTYVGVIPVLLGMTLLPLLRHAGRGPVRALLAVTVGLLAFLAVDGGAEGLKVAERNGGAFGGALLVLLGAALAYLLLTGVDRWMQGKRRHAHGDASGGPRLAMMLAIGIGLHNLGEGLAIGSAYAVGELALGTALVIGFALHNTTEGIAIVAPLAAHRPSVLRLLSLGLIAGAPAILGALLGAAVNNAELSAFLLGVGVGAIIQVIIQIMPAVQERNSKALDPLALSGIAGGVLIMYLTGLLIAA